MNIEKKLDQITKEMPQDITLVAVTKHRSVDEIQRVVDYGIRDLGENRVQELLDKYDKIQGDIRWHLIGHLQTNKVKYIIDKVDLIHSVDSVRLAKEINAQAKKHGRIMKILIQVNVSMEDSKFGIGVEELESFLQEISHESNISIIGFMTMAPFTENIEETRHIFREMREIYDKIKDNQGAFKNLNIKTLSMGMTNDYPVAIEEGSNLVRIGRGIFV